MTFFRRLSLRAKMYLIILAVVFPIAAGACFHLVVMYRADYRKAEKAAVATTQSIAYQYNNRVEGIRSLLTTLSYVPEVRNRDRKACTSILRKILLQSPSTTNIGVADLRGNLLASGIPQHRSIRETKFFRDALRTGRFSAGEFGDDPIAGKPAISFALPVPDASGRPVAILFATFDLGAFNHIFDTRNLSARSMLTLTDNRGIVLHRYPGRDEVRPGAVDRPALRARVTGSADEGVFIGNGLDGAKRLSAFKRLRLNPAEPPYLYIRVSTPEDSVLAGLNQYIVRSMLLFTLVALIAVGLNHFLVGRIFVFPLERMASVAGSVENSDLSVRTGLQDAGAEMGLLAKSFDAMTESLAARQRESFRAESLLRASEEKLHEIFDHIGDPIFIQDLDSGAIREVNRAAYEMYGDHDETCGLSFEEVGRDEPPCSLTEALGRMSRATGMEPRTTEWLVRHGDGRLSWAEVTMRRAAIGGSDSLIALVRDITERKAAGDLIRLKEAQLRTLIDNLPFQLWAMDAGGRYFMQNAVSREFWGNNIGKRPVEAPVTGDVVKKWMEDNDRAFAGEVVRGEVEYPVDGELRSFDTIIAPIRTEQSIIGIMGVNIDITARKSLESQLYHAQKMEAVGQLAGGIAHDFNNIVTAIISYTHLLEGKTAWDDSIPAYAGQIRGCAERAAEVTRGLLAFSRKQVMRPHVVNLDDLVDREQKMLKMFVGGNIDFRFQPSGERLAVLVDRVKMEQILMNLVVNGRDAMPEGGSLVIETSSMAMDDTFIQKHGFGEPGGYACLSVSDTGCGMNPETVKKMFEPFFSTKEAGQGTGLGLAVVYGMVKQHNGYITVESESGRGTVFRIYLPLADAQESGGRSVRSASSPSPDRQRHAGSGPA